MNRFQQIAKELQTLDTKDPGAWPLYVRIAAAVVLLVAVAVFGYFYFITEQLDELAKVQQQEKVLKDDFEAKQRKVAALDALKEQLAEMERTFGAMLRQLPSRAEIANLLIDISQTRLASSLEEELFQPQSELPREFYAEVPNRIVVVGHYHEMGAFVSGVAALPRIVTVDDIDIRGAAGPQKDLLRMQATAKTYRYLDAGEVAPPPAKKK
ncbi:MAG TPA: type 4a pilus biogenesis protein PilO [Candidatus Binatia bacterium]|nr:type 4a pilus biogenesis protein PilO [Candidatus Binatia bacterium]